jgi:ATP-dependent protease ClpP protease subunit
MNRRHIIRQLRNKGIGFEHTASTAELKGLLDAAMRGDVSNKLPHHQAHASRQQFVFNCAGGKARIRLAFNAAAPEEPAEIMVFEEIGRNAWSGDGIGVQDIQQALDAITPKTRPLNFLIDSPGGNYNTGCAIHNLLSQWQGLINKTVIGVAASTASWMVPADKTFAYKNSQFFMHRAMCAPFGNVDDLREAIDFLNRTDAQIAQMYADQTGNDPADMLDLMVGNNKQGTLLTGQEALEQGMVDELIDGEATNQFSPEWLNSAREKLSALNSISALPGQGEGKNNDNNKNNEDKTMNRQQKIALLNQRGITIPPAALAAADDAQLDALISQSNIEREFCTSVLNDWKVSYEATATNAQLKALVNAGKPPAAPAPAAANANAGLSADDQATLKLMRNQLEQQRRREIRNRLEHLASAAGGHRIPVNQIADWEAEALACQDGPEGNRILNQLAKLPEQAPGVPPVAENTRVDVVNADIKDITRKFESFNEVTQSWQRGNSVGYGNKSDMEVIRNAAIEKAHFFRKARNRFLEIANANTMPAQLQRQVILQDVVIRDFARRVIALSMFGTVFRDIPLQGLHTLEVPYYDLDTSASQSFKNATGYNTLGNTVTGVREITIGQGPNDDGGLGVGHNRAYIGLQFSSWEIARQPYLKIAELAGLKAEKLAFDIFQDVLSVISVANFGAAAIVKAANQIDSDQIALLKLACKAWPAEGRGLMVDSAVDANLLQDPSFKFALNAASDLAIKEGRLFPRVMGFDYAENPNLSNLPNPGIANLLGFAVWKYAILVGFAPVPPVEEVRNAGTVWEMVIDPPTGVTLEYRRFGTNVTDTASNIIESSYGFAKGLGTALKAIVSA